MGEVRLQQNRIDEAEEFYRQAYAISPASAAFFVADIHFRRGQHAQAEAFYEEAASKNPPNVAILMEQGENFARQNKLREAINTWQAALKIDPEFELAQRCVADAEAALAARKAAILGQPATSATESE
jgi:tetratricopeptide (TPR) repeat protein